MQSNYVLSKWIVSWWRHWLETFPALLAFCAGNSPVNGDFPAQRPMTRSFDVFFDLRLYQQLNKQWRCRWFETPSRSLWRHCNACCRDKREIDHELQKNEAWQNDLHFEDNFKGILSKEIYILWFKFHSNFYQRARWHYSNVIIIVMASQVTGVSIVCLTICSGADQRKYQSSESLAFVRGIHRSPHKGQWRGKCFHLMTPSWQISFLLQATGY